MMAPKSPKSSSANGSGGGGASSSSSSTFSASAPTSRTTSLPSSVPEEIMRKLRLIYAHPDNGLVKTASLVGVPLLPPREKITVLLIGNHSAGKSSFINWYIGEHVLRVGVAMETTNVHFVTSGKRRETLTGPATLELYPHFKSLAKHCEPQFISTEVSTSKARRFPMLTFVDTPGLVDGDMQYAFDIERTIEWLAGEADIILVFFDPMGQALCNRTLNVVETLHKLPGVARKMHFYLSKADEMTQEKDRQRVITQVTQNLCRRQGLNQYGFDLGTIFIPREEGNITRCVNQIEEVCEHFSKTINLAVQTTLDNMIGHCDAVEDACKTTIEKAEQERSRSSRRKASSVAAILVLLLVCAWGGLQMLFRVGVKVDAGPIDKIEGLDLQTNLAAIFVPVLMLFAIVRFWPRPPALSAAQIADMKRRLKELEGVRRQKNELYKEYLNDSLHMEARA